jgi:hypothetical protein
VTPLDLAAIAIGAVTAIGLAHVWADYRLHIRMADRVRVVNPVKAPAPEADAANVAELEKRRTA